MLLSLTVLYGKLCRTLNFVISSLCYLVLFCQDFWTTLFSGSSKLCKEGNIPALEDKNCIQWELEIICMLMERCCVSCLGLVSSLPWKSFLLLSPVPLASSLPFCCSCRWMHGDWDKALSRQGSAERFCHCVSFTEPALDIHSNTSQMSSLPSWATAFTAVPLWFLSPKQTALMSYLHWVQVWGRCSAYGLSCP